MSKCYLVALLFCLITFFMSCKEEKGRADSEKESADDVESREDSISLAHAYTLQSDIKIEVHAQVETEPIKANSSEDAADDPAIWVNKTNPQKSIIYGSNKAGGLAAYDLGGTEVFYYPIGKINNVDVIQDFAYNPDSSISVLGCSNRTSQGVDLFRIEESTGELISIPLVDYIKDKKIDDIYGFCFGKFENDDFVFINGKNGWMQQFIISYVDDIISLTLVREMKFDGQVEGMVAWNENNQFFVGEENKGIWQLSIDPNTMNKKFIISSNKENNPYIAYDIEGLAISRTNNHNWLIASSQGNFSYAIFDLNESAEYITSIKITEGVFCDGVEETDGLEIININKPDPQNFKYVNWGNVISKIQQSKVL